LTSLKAVALPERAEARKLELGEVGVNGMARQQHHELGSSEKPRTCSRHYAFAAFGLVQVFGARRVEDSLPTTPSYMILVKKKATRKLRLPGIGFTYMQHVKRLRLEGRITLCNTCGKMLHFTTIKRAVAPLSAHTPSG
jgi:hypothetical protein